jgi:uroporphyrinogen-III decarboxylase
MMTSRERITKCFNFEKTDKPPVWDWIRNDEVIKFFSGSELRIETGRRQVIETYRKCVDATKQEMRFPQPDGETTDKYGIKYHRSKWTEWAEPDQRFFNENNLIQAMRACVANYSWNSEAETALNAALQDCKTLEQDCEPVVIFPCIGHVGLTEAYELCGGLEKFIYFYYDNPSLVAGFIDYLCQRTIDRLAHVPDDFRPLAVFVGDDIAYKNGLIFSPGFLKENFIPHLRKVVDAYHAIGAKVLFHTDGNAWEIMDDLVDAGIDGFNPIETVSGMCVRDLRKRYPRLVLCGGVDVSHLMAFGTPDECYAATMENINSAPAGYIVGGSAEIHNEVKLENYLAMLRAVENSASR